MRLVYLTLFLAVNDCANGLSIYNTTILQPPSSSSANLSASLQFRPESLCGSPEVLPLSRLAPDSYHCFITGGSRLLYVEANFHERQTPSQHPVQDRSDLLSAADSARDVLDSLAAYTHNAFLPGPTLPTRFSQLTFTEGGMNIATATFPCVGTINPFLGFSKIRPARYGDMALLITTIRALVTNKVSNEKNLATIRIFEFDHPTRLPFDLQRSSMLGMMVMRSTQIADLLPNEMRMYERYTCTEAEDQTSASVAVT